MSKKAAAIEEFVTDLDKQLDEAIDSVAPAKEAKPARYTPEKDETKVIKINKAKFTRAALVYGRTLTSAKAPEFCMRLQLDYGLMRIWQLGKPQEYTVVPVSNIDYMTVEE